MSFVPLACLFFCLKIIIDVSHARIAMRDYSRVFAFNKAERYLMDLGLLGILQFINEDEFSIP